MNQIVEHDQEKLQQVAAEIPSEKLQQVAAEYPFPIAFGYVPWGHHLEIISKCSSIAEALFYIQRTIEAGWSRSAVENSMQADIYHKTGTAVTNFDERLPAPQSKLAQELLKENYDLGFITLPNEYDETDLETAIEQRMTRFLLELGDGWAFVGRQKEIIVSGKTRKIDGLIQLDIDVLQGQQYERR